MDRNQTYGQFIVLQKRMLAAIKQQLGRVCLVDGRIRWDDWFRMNGVTVRASHGRGEPCYEGTISLTTDFALGEEAVRIVDRHGRTEGDGQADEYPRWISSPVTSGWLSGSLLSGVSGAPSLSWRLEEDGRLTCTATVDGEWDGFGEEYGTPFDTLVSRALATMALETVDASCDARGLHMMADAFRPLAKALASAWALASASWKPASDGQGLAVDGPRDDGWFVTLDGFELSATVERCVEKATSGEAGLYDGWDEVRLQVPIDGLPRKGAANPRLEWPARWEPYEVWYVPDAFGEPAQKVQSLWYGPDEGGVETIRVVWELGRKDDPSAFGQLSPSRQRQLLALAVDDLCQRVPALVGACEQLADLCERFAADVTGVPADEAARALEVGSFPLAMVRINPPDEHGRS